jgi:hypothetical protein
VTPRPTKAAQQSASSSGVRLASGLTPPSSGVHLARGLTPPSSGARLLKVLPARTCSRTCVRAFNALTQQDRATARLGITPRRCSANSLGGAHPHHCGGLCEEAGAASRRCATHSCTANAPRPRRGVGRTLEPSSRDSAGSNSDVRPAGAPSPSLFGHPRPCCATLHTATTAPTLLSTRGRDAATPATAPCTDRCQRLPRARSKTPWSTTTPLPSKPPLFGHRTRHDGNIRQDGRQLFSIVRHTATRKKIVWHACKSHSPWPIKGRRSPPHRRGSDNGQQSLTRSPLSPRYWHSPQSNPLGLGGQPPLPPRL